VLRSSIDFFTFAGCTHPVQYKYSMRSIEIFWPRALRGKSKDSNPNTIDRKLPCVTVDEKGGGLIFDTRTGRYRFCEWHEKVFACRSSSADRTWEPYWRQSVRMKVHNTLTQQKKFLEVPPVA
jgi:hypothetical protein